MNFVIKPKSIKMKNIMMVILFFVRILYIQPVFGMDSWSDDPDSNNTEDVNLPEYTKQEQEVGDLYDNQKIIPYDEKKLFNANNFQKYQTEANSDVKHSSQDFEENFDDINELKRKHKSEKIIRCEFCQKHKNRYRKSLVNGKTLCEACYKYERKHGYLIHPDKRKKYQSVHKDILVCEFCQEERTGYTRSKVSGKSLCPACYRYESRHGYLVTSDERNKHQIHKFKNILKCEFCQKEKDKYYTKGKMSGKSLCKTCYYYESRHGHLVPLDKRNSKHKDHILVCEVCQKESTQYKKGQVSGKSLCNVCYQYERKHGHLRPCNEQNIHKIHQDINNQPNCFIDAKEYSNKNEFKVKEKL